MSSASIAGIGAYREACARCAASVAIATVCDQDGNPHGLTISSFTPVSLVPPLVLICIDIRCSPLDRFREAGWFAVNVLNSGQRELSEAFSAKPDQRFDGVDWRPGETGAPRIAGVIATFECRKTNTIEAGDHAVLFGEVVAVDFAPGEPLVYHLRAYRGLEPAR